MQVQPPFTWVPILFKRADLRVIKYINLLDYFSFSPPMEGSSSELEAPDVPSGFPLVSAFLSPEF